MGEEKGLIEGATYPPLTLVSNYWLRGGGGINVPGGEKQKENIEKGIPCSWSAIKTIADQ